MEDCHFALLDEGNQFLAVTIAVSLGKTDAKTK